MNKVCVIAGVGPGNGASLSRRFSAEDYTVVMLARNQDYLDSLSREIPGSIPMVCDVREPDAIALGPCDDLYVVLDNPVVSKSGGVRDGVTADVVERVVDYEFSRRLRRYERQQEAAQSNNR